MFYGIGDIDLPAIDAGFFQRAVEHQPCRSHEWFAGKVFLVAGLLADQHHRDILRAFAEHGLRRMLPEMTGAAMAGLVAQSFETEAGHACRHGRFPVAGWNVIAAGEGSMPAGGRRFPGSHWDYSRKS